MKKLSFLQNTVLLIASNLITGSLVFLFSIILSKEIGAHGVGLYQMIMPIYMLFICFTCGGTTTALSKIVAEQHSKNNTRELYRSVSVSIAFFSFWTILTSIFLIIFAPLISTVILKDARTYQPILIFVPALLFVAIGSIIKGYFYGLQNSAFPAVIDIVEKCVRIIVLVTLVTGLKGAGLKYQVAGAVVAMTAGEFMSVILLYIFYRKSRKSVKHYVGTPDNVFQIITNVLKISLPLCINGFISTVLGAVIAVLIPLRLQTAGFSAETSLALFGKLTGMGFNIIMYPAIIIGSISIILVPVISEASVGKSMQMVNRRIYSTIRVTAAIAAFSAGVFFSLPNELGKLFYSRTDLGGIIYSLSFGVFFIYIESTLFGILNGLGKQGVLLRNTIIMSIIDIVLLYTLIGIPEINIYGFGINLVVSPLAGCILNSLEIKKVTGIEIKFRDFFAFPIFIAIVEIVALKNLKSIISLIIPSQNYATVTLMLIGLLIYSGLYFLFPAIIKLKSNR